MARRKKDLSYWMGKLREAEHRVDVLSSYLHRYPHPYESGYLYLPEKRRSQVKFRRKILQIRRNKRRKLLKNLVEVRIPYFRERIRELRPSMWERLLRQGGPFQRDGNPSNVDEV